MVNATQRRQERRPPVNLDILSDAGARRDPTRPAVGCLDLGARERCTRGSAVFSCGSKSWKFRVR